MINVSNEFKKLMQARTDFKEYAEITFTDGTKITLDESQFTTANNSVTDGAALSAVPVGVAIQKIVQLEILNDQEQWESYDFYGARIHLYLTFELSSTTEKVERGYYTVTTPETYGDTIIVTAYDDMYKADQSYDSDLKYPATIKDMLIEICGNCSIPLLSTTFTHDDFTVSAKPDSQYTYRQIISYIAMLAGGNARINNAGYLEIITYSNITSNTYYGNLTGIETGAPERVLNAWQSLTMDKSDITVTGVAIKIDTQNGQEKRITGDDGYVPTVYNPLIDASNETALATAMNNISEHLVGLKFRKFDGVSVSNPLIEFMDFVAVKDRRGRLYQSFVTDITFTFLGASTIKNSAESAVRTETVYAGNVNTEIRMRKLVEAEKLARELAVSNLSNALENSSGLYETAEVQPDGSTIYYLHDKPTLAESKAVIKLAADAIGVSPDGGKTYPYGFTITGEMVTRLLAAEGINADWIKTGALTISDASGNEIFNADLDKKTVNMSSAMVSVDGTSLTSKFGASKTYTDEQVSYMEQAIQRTYATQSSVSQTASEIRTEVSNGVTEAKSYAEQQVDAIKLQIVNSSGNVVSEISMDDSKIKLTGDTIADAITVAKLFANDITVSGNFTIDNDGYYLGSYVIPGDGDVAQSDTTAVKLSAADGRNSTYIELSKLGISLLSSGEISISTPQSEALRLNDQLWYSGDWTPTLNNVGSYTLQDGHYSVLGGLTVVSFRIRGTFNTSTGKSLTISGCPVKPSSDYAGGGGHLSGYHAADNTVFSGWRMNTAGSIIACGQLATTSANERDVQTIYPRSGATFELAGTIAF